MHIRTVTIAVICGLCVSNSSFAETFTIDGVKVELSILEGYCYLDRSHEADRAYYEQQDKLQKGRNVVVALIARCADIKILRSGKAIRFYGMWLLQAPGGNVARLPAHLSRQRVIDEFSKIFPRLNTAKLASDAKKSAKGVGVTLDTQSIGVIDSNSDAVYLGLLSTAAAATSQQSFQFAGVAGITSIEQRVFSFNLYRPYENQATYTHLLREVKEVMRQTVSQDQSSNWNRSLPAGMQPPNVPTVPAGMQPPHEPTLGASTSFEWNRIISKAVGGAIVGGILMAAVGVWRSFRRRGRSSD